MIVGLFEPQVLENDTMVLEFFASFAEADGKLFFQVVKKAVSGYRLVAYKAFDSWNLLECR